MNQLNVTCCGGGGRGGRKLQMFRLKLPFVLFLFCDSGVGTSVVVELMPWFPNVF